MQIIFLICVNFGVHEVIFEKTFFTCKINSLLAKHIFYSKFSVFGDFYTKLPA